MQNDFSGSNTFRGEEEGPGLTPDQHDLLDANQQNGYDKNTKLHGIQQIQPYKKRQHPIVSQQNKRIIKETLDMEQKALKKTRGREITGDYFVNYSYNPFMPHQKEEKKRLEAYEQEKNPKKISKNNLIDQLNKMAHVEFKEHFQEEIGDFQDLKDKFKKLSSQLKAASSITRQLKAIQSAKIDDRGSAAKIEEYDTSVREWNLPFRSILQIQQSNYFLERKMNLNVFRYASGNKSGDVLGPEILKKYFFSFVTDNEKIQKIKVTIYRDISRLSRKLMEDLEGKDFKSERNQLIDSIESSFKLYGLTGGDLLSIASGRFYPMYISQRVNRGSVNIAQSIDNSSSQQSDTELIYAENTENRSSAFQNKNQDEQEIYEYLKLAELKEEEASNNNYSKEKEHILSLLREKEQLYNDTIFDFKSHQAIQEKIKQSLDYFIKTEKVKQSKPQNQRGSQEEAIKLKEMIQTLQMLNNHQAKAKHLIKEQNRYA